MYIILRLLRCALLFRTMNKRVERNGRSTDRLKWPRGTWTDEIMDRLSRKRKNQTIPSGTRDGCCNRDHSIALSCFFASNDALMTSIGEARSNPGIPSTHLSLRISSTRIYDPWLIFFSDSSFCKKSLSHRNKYIIDVLAPFLENFEFILIFEHSS